MCLCVLVFLFLYDPKRGVHCVCLCEFGLRGVLQVWIFCTDKVSQVNDDFGFLVKFGFSTLYHHVQCEREVKLADIMLRTVTTDHRKF